MRFGFTDPTSAEAQHQLQLLLQLLTFVRHPQLAATAACKRNYVVLPVDELNIYTSLLFVLNRELEIVNVIVLREYIRDLKLKVVIGLSTDDM